MSENIYRYQFDGAIAPLEVEATLVLAVIATEAIHGELATRLGVAHCFDAEKRACVIDASDPVGRDFNSLFLGFARQEFGAGAFHVRRVTAPEPSTPIAA